MWVSFPYRKKNITQVRRRKPWVYSLWMKVALVMAVAILPRQFHLWTLDIKLNEKEKRRKSKQESTNKTDQLQLSDLRAINVTMDGLNVQLRDELPQSRATERESLTNATKVLSYYSGDTNIEQEVPILINSFRGIIARPFDSWPKGTPFPCYQPYEQWKDESHQSTPATKGFFYLKPYKTGSSTTSGVHLRMARNIAKRRIKQHFNICETRFSHGPTFTPGYTLFRHRIQEKSFLWTIMRDPTKRAISHFFHFIVSRGKYEPTDRNFLTFLRNGTFPIQDYYYHALYTKTNKFNRVEHKPISAANHILRTYNFIGIAERMDESFVALMMILRLKIADILYLSAKTNGGYDDAGGKRKSYGCTYIWPSFVTSGMKDFFNSSEWRYMIRYDRLLYEAVNRSLDLTIDQLGRERFHEKLKHFQKAQRVANEQCLHNTTFPCDTSGRFHSENKTDCIWKDSGCGTTCLDEIATEFGLW